MFRTHPVDRVATYTIQWPWANARRVVQTWQTYAPHAPDGLFCVLNLNAAGGGAPQITSAGQFFGTREQLESLIRPLVNAGTPTRVSVTSRTYMEPYASGQVHRTIAECHLQPQGQLGRSTFKGKSDYANRPLSQRGIATLVAQIESRAAGGPGSGIVLLDSSGGAINRTGKAATAFVHRDGLFSFQYLSYWDVSAPATVAGANLNFLRHFRTAMRPHVSGFAYQNYIDPELANWRHAYYGSNFTRLVAVKRRYDPRNVFRFQQSIPTTDSAASPRAAAPRSQSCRDRVD